MSAVASSWSRCSPLRSMEPEAASAALGPFAFSLSSRATPRGNADARRSGLPKIALRSLQPKFGKFERALERIQIQPGCFSSYLESERCCRFFLVLAGREPQIINVRRNTRRLSRIGRWEPQKPWRSNEAVEILRLRTFRSQWFH